MSPIALSESAHHTYWPTKPRPVEDVSAEIPDVSGPIPVLRKVTAHTGAWLLWTDLPAREYDEIGPGPYKSDYINVEGDAYLKSRGAFGI